MTVIGLLMMGAVLAGGPAAAQVDAPVGQLVIGLDAQDVRPGTEGQLWIVEAVDAGSSAERRVVVRNDSTQILDVRLYAGPAAVRDGAFGPTDTPEDPSTRNVAPATWMTVDPGAVTLAPGETAGVAVRIAPPASAADGEYLGVVWAEIDGDTTGPVRQTARVGVRTYLTVGGGLPPIQLEVGAPRTADGDDRQVCTDVRNSGQRSTEATTRLALQGGSVSAEVAGAQTPALTPGAVAQVCVPVPDDVGGGQFDATLTITAADDSEHTGQGAVLLGTGTGSGPAVQGAVGGAADRGGLLLLAALLLATVSAGHARRWAAARRPAA